MTEFVSTPDLDIGYEADGPGGGPVAEAILRAVAGKIGDTVAHGGGAR